jgi:hypothetical protein
MKEGMIQLNLFNDEECFPEPDPVRVRRIEQLAIEAVRSYGLKVRSVKWKNNRRVMASVGKGGVLNIHTIYKRAHKSDLTNLAVVMSGKAKSKDFEQFQKYIHLYLPKETGEGKSRLVINPARGLFHDLNVKFARVLPLLKKPLKTAPKLGWSPVRVGSNGITWGTQREAEGGPLILVNAVLDSPDTPNFVVEHILWHELCHQVVPPENGNGNGTKRIVHGKAFREMEARYPRLKAAEEWEQKNVGRLIRKHKCRRG